MIIWDCTKSAHSLIYLDLAFRFTHGTMSRTNNCWLVDHRSSTNVRKYSNLSHLQTNLPGICIYRKSNVHQKASIFCYHYVIPQRLIGTIFKIYTSTINSQKRYIRISFLMHLKTTLEIPSDNLAWIILQSIIDALKSDEN